MDLGVLKDMPGIRDRASAKLAHKEVATLSAGTQPFLNGPRFNFLLVSSFSCLSAGSGAMPRDASVNLQGDGNADTKTVFVQVLFI
jgi:hypothetical protein